MEKLNFQLLTISGGSASGKSSIIREIRTTFSEDEVCIILQDNYYKPIEFQVKDEKGVYNFDLPEAIDSELFFTDLMALSDGNTLEKQEYTFNHPEKLPVKFTLKPAPVVIAEGIFVGHFRKISEMADLKVYVDADEEICFQRRFERDIREREIPEFLVHYQWNSHVLPAYRKYVEPCKKEADLVINNHFSYQKGLEVLLAYIRLHIGKK